jgi:hypothetical protein
MYKDFYHQIGMKVAFASVYHPLFNGMVERVNALIFEAIKKSLKERKRGSKSFDEKKASHFMNQKCTAKMQGAQSPSTKKQASCFTNQKCTPKM